MIGITSYGAYIPWYRMDRKVVSNQMSWFAKGNAKGEKAVVNHDEDTITMAYAAANNCISNTDRNLIGGVFMASLSFPFANRQNAGVVANALNLKYDVRTADLAGALKSGTAALLNAIESVASGNTAAAIACASDSRAPKPGSAGDYTYVDGAAAFLIGTEDVIAEYKGYFSTSYDFIDTRRLSDEPFERTWEERWIREEGVMKQVPEAVKGLCEKLSVNIEDISKIVIASPNAGNLNAVAKKLKMNPEKVQDNLVVNIGDTGTALSYLMLISTLETAKPKDKIIVVSYGYGCDALLFEVTEEVTKAQASLKGLKPYLENKRALDSYARYLAYHNVIPLDNGVRGENVAYTALSVLWRQGRSVSALVGTKCKVCGTLQFPTQPVCVNPECGSIEQFEPYCFADKIGKIVSFTSDYLAFSMDPPQYYGLLDMPEGGRLYLEFTDCTNDQIKVGNQLEMTFRKKYTDNVRSHIVYFWKAKPVI